jgi:undecaprenyl-diphosphatase
VRFPPAEAVALGALHGPAELLPISSSGHLTLVPWLLGWEYADLDGELRKAFEIALHAGTGAALLIALRDEVAEVARRPSRRLLCLITLSFAPPALVGYVLQRPIERRLGTPGTIAAALIAGGVAMAWADRRPQVRGSEDAGPLDAVCLGLGQACALVPGVSRNGATLVAARLRRFAREDADRLSRHVALPVIAGAAALKAVRLRGSGLPPRMRLPFLLGAVTSFASTLGSSRLIGRLEPDRSLAPYAAYRIGLAAAAIGRLARQEAMDVRTAPT